VLEGAEAAHVLKLLRDDAEEVYSHYLEMLNQDESGRTLDDGRTGLARELARMNLSLNFYTQWYWKTDLHNLLGFLRLRADKHAQYEIRIYAEKLLEIVKAWVPLTYEAFEEHRLNGTSLSATAVRALQSALTGRQVTKENNGLSAREWGELVAIFNSLERTK
jgi:thymidylate synthase (FAD)